MNWSSPLLGAALLSTLAGSLSASPASSTLNLVNEATKNKITVGLNIPGFGGSSSAVTTLTGALNIDWDIDSTTGQASVMTITSGTVSGTPISLSAGNAFSGGYNFSSTTLGGSIFTAIPPGTVTPATGLFDATQHNFEINSGTVSGNVTVLFVPVAQSIDFATSPVLGTGNGNGTVILSETSSTATTTTYDAVIEFGVNILNIIPITDPVTVDITVTAIGTIKAAGSVTVPKPNPYVAWAIANSIPGALFGDDANGDGIANGMLWALGLAASDKPFPNLPAMGGANTATFVLPVGGSAGDLLVETSTTLLSPSWGPLAAGAISTGTNPIPAGTTGTVTITLPSGDPVRGVRLKAMEP